MTHERVSADEILALLHTSLQRGMEVTIAPRGQSMKPFIRDRDELVCRRLEDGEPRLGDIVALRRLGDARILFHRVVRVGALAFETRGDALAGPDGWISRDELVAVVSSVNGKKRRECALGRVGRRIVAILSRTGLLHLATGAVRVFRIIERSLRKTAAKRWRPSPQEIDGHGTARIPSQPPPTSS